MYKGYIDLKYTTIFIIAIKAIPCLDLGDDKCRRIVNGIKQPPQDEKQLLESLLPIVLEYYESEQLDEEWGTVYTESLLWKAVDYYFFILNYKIDIIGCLDADYPKDLLDLEDYPVLLYAKGDVNILNNPKRIAVVGTREPSEYGKRVAERLGQRLAESDIVVISGLAKGCDTAANWGCINTGGKTVAVLAHGIDHVYPEENLELAETILAKGGCLVSEYVPPDKPIKASFIERDRIQAALSKAVVVVESEVGGGTMHTARSALKLGRKLGCMSYLPGKSGTQDAKLDGNEYLISTANASRLVDAKDLDAFVSGLEAQDNIQP